MPEDFDSDELLVRYHLGELSPGERDAVEDRYFADNAFHERVLAAEEELIDSYVRGELSNKQRKHFESWFLRTDDRLKKLEFAKALARYLTDNKDSILLMLIRFGNQTNAARYLGISRRTLADRMKKYGIPTVGFKELKQA